MRLRFGVGRDKAAVEPGLYFAGEPDAGSPVLVTANYRLTFDAVRKELGNLSVWLLVIDTKGVNVWCSAGKGTFCAEEIGRRIALTALDRLAPQATLVLPQLSASGVDARGLSAATGRRVVFGPVYARDIVEFLESGMKKAPSMRKVRFALRDRAVIIPVELSHSWPLLPVIAVVAACAAFPGNGTEGPMFSPLWTASFGARFIPALVMLFGSLVMGTLAFPLLLPVLPGRFFSVKGCVLAVAWNAAVLFAARGIFQVYPFVAISSVLIGCALSGYLAMNFTGASTFTSQRGTEREVSLSLPVMAASAGAGALLAIIRLLLAFVRGGAA